MTQLETDLNYISSLADQPAMTTAALKQEFDKAGNVIKDFINQTLEPEITSSIASCLASAKSYADSAIGALNFDADSISYDNTSSGLAADNVQDAIDEVKTTTDNLSTSVSGKVAYDDFGTTTESITLSFTPGQKRTGTITSNKAGYYPLSIAGESNNQEAVDIRSAMLTSRAIGSATITYMLLNEDYGNNRTATMGFEILWVKVS